MHTTYFIQALGLYMGPTPVYGARAEKPLQNADFAMKQTNICRLSGDIITMRLQQIATRSIEVYCPFCPMVDVCH